MVKNGKNGKMVKSRLKKSAPECPFECGGGRGGAKAIRAMPKCPQYEFQGGLPLQSFKLKYTSCGLRNT